MLIYAAYGSNLNRHQMQIRCPASKPYLGTVLSGWKLVFKGVADIEEMAGEEVFLGLYKITNTCQESLDMYEEVPKVYKKKHLNFLINGKEIKVMTYVMTNTYKYGKPSQKYYDVIKKGYMDWNFNKNKLIEAGKHSISFNSYYAYKSKNWIDNNYINSNYLEN